MPGSPKTYLAIGTEPELNYMTLQPEVAPLDNMKRKGHMFSSGEGAYLNDSLPSTLEPRRC
jgi:hypothetical protein